MQSNPIVEDLDVFADRFASRLPREPGFSINQLRLQRPEEALETAWSQQLPRRLMPRDGARVEMFGASRQKLRYRSC